MTEIDNPEVAAEIKKSPTLDANGRAIEAGDVVMLLHDQNVLMTVEFADDTDRTNIVSAIWFDVNDQLQRGNFVGKTLICCDEVVESQTLDS